MERARLIGPSLPGGTSGAESKVLGASPITVGTTVANRYHVHTVLGSGGSGVVHAATDLINGEEVALKVLAACTTTSLRRLRREATLGRAARSERLCRVYYLGVDRGSPFLVMERLVGEPLRARLRRDGPPTVADAIAITIQVLEGLEAAHAAGVIHRDVKPGNIFVTSPPAQAPQIKLIDFGLARTLPSFSHGKTEEEAITKVGTAPGTPHYLTPEQLGGARDLDARVDVWATALTLFELLTGRRAHPHSGSIETLVAQILRTPTPTVCHDRDDLPPELDHVLATALAKDRRRRYASASEFRTALVEVWASHQAARIAHGASRGRSSLRRFPLWTDGEDDDTTSEDIDISDLEPSRT